MDDRELVIIGKPTDGPGVKCRRCGTVCELGPPEWACISRGGSVLCRECSWELWFEYGPSAFKRAD